MILGCFWIDFRMIFGKILDDVGKLFGLFWKDLEMIMGSGSRVKNDTCAWTPNSV